MIIRSVFDLFSSAIVLMALTGQVSGTAHAAVADEPAQGATTIVDLGHDVTLEVVYIPAGEFKMGSTNAEKARATGIEGGVTPGTERESHDGAEPRLMRVKDGFWMACMSRRKLFRCAGQCPLCRSSRTPEPQLLRLPRWFPDLSGSAAGLSRSDRKPPR